MASYTLHIQYVDRPAETRTFTQAKVILGRDAGDIVLHDSQVSGRHGEISWDGSTLRFTDLGSTNGSFLLQGQRVANLELTVGIALRLGNSLITVQAIEGAGPGKGRTVIAGPGMVPGFPAPMKAPMPARPPGPLAPPVAPPGPAPQGGFAFAPTAQLQNPGILQQGPGMPGLRPPAPQPMGAAVPQPMAPPAPMAPPQPMPLATPVPPPQPMAPPQPVAMPVAPAPQPTPVATPAPFPAAPAPQPPGPPPGTLSGAQAQQAAAPAPVPAAPVAVQPVPAAVPVPAAAAPAGAATLPESPDLGAAIKHILKQAWGVLAPVAPTVIVTLAAIFVPIAALGALLVSILPLGLLGIVGLLLMLVQLAAAIILLPATNRYLLGSYLGQPISIQAAIQGQVARAADVAVHCFIPMIPLGVFSAPIYFVEQKKIGAVIGRNFNLLGKELVPILVSGLAFAIAVAIPQVILGMILIHLPFGGVLVAVVNAVITSVLLGYFAALSVSLYFAVRRKHEGGDPEGEARAALSGTPALSA